MRVKVPIDLLDNEGPWRMNGNLKSFSHYKIKPVLLESEARFRTGHLHLSHNESTHKGKMIRLVIDPDRVSSIPKFINKKKIKKLE